MTITAHAGHWAVQLLYALPVLAVVAVIVREKVRERRERRLSDPESRDYGS